MNSAYTHTLHLYLIASFHVWLLVHAKTFGYVRSLALGCVNCFHCFKAAPSVVFLVSTDSFLSVCFAGHRRAMKGTPNFRCTFQKKCAITKRNRRQCQSCRLQKCLSIGMLKECAWTAFLTAEFIPLLSLYSMFCPYCMWYFSLSSIVSFPTYACTHSLKRQH